MLKQSHLIVKGKVQGVYFRACTRQAAEKYALTGWVRNLPNGDVEMMLQGPLAELEKMKQWCWQGSPHSEVTHVIVQDNHQTIEQHFSGFQIRH